MKSILTINKLSPMADLPDQDEGVWLMHLHDEGNVPRCAVVVCDDVLATGVQRESDATEGASPSP